MASPAAAPTPLRPWKRVAIISFFSGAGFAIFLALIVALFLWYSSRPTPPKPWNTGALVVSGGSPGFHRRNDGKAIQFEYTVENRTTNDYHVESATDFKLLVKTQAGILSEPLPDDAAVVNVPIFIPATQKGTLIISVLLSGIPEQGEQETNEQYHEKLRGFCNDHLRGIAGFVLFDDANRYQVILPRWLAERPK